MKLGVWLGVMALTLFVSSAAHASDPRAPTIGVSCSGRNSSGAVSCSLSGHGFAAYKTIRLAYVLHASSATGQTYNRVAQTDAGGAFSLPPIVLALPASYSLSVTAQVPGLHHLVRMDVSAGGGWILSWSCGGASASGRTPCRLRGRGFRPHQVLTIVYDAVFLRAGKMQHENYRRHIRAGAHGGFTRPAIWFSLPPSYRITVYVNRGPVGAVPYVVAQVTASAGKLSAPAQ